MPIYRKPKGRYPAPVHTLQVGDRVAFTRAFLRSTASYSGWYPHARGEVVEVGCHGGPFVMVRWDGWPEPRLCHGSNLVREDRLHLEAA